MYLSVVIPAYNEAKRIGPTLGSVFDYLAKQTYDYEVLVVNDGSSDDTVEVVRNFVSSRPTLKLIDNKQNHGKGWVVRQGMLAAQGEWRLFMDADNSTPLDQLENLWPYTKQGYDIVVGSRRIKGAVIAVHQPWIRDFLGGVFRLIVRILVPVSLIDTQAGFKLFSRQAAEKVFPRQTIYRWAFDVEILALARKMKLKIAEAPIVWKNDATSRVKLKGMIAMLFEVVTIRWNLLTGAYQ